MLVTNLIQWKKMKTAILNTKDPWEQCSCQSKRKFIFHLISNNLGVNGPLIFNHEIEPKHSCRQQKLGTAVTLIHSGKSRYPTMHFVCLSHKDYLKRKKIIANRLLIHNRISSFQNPVCRLFTLNELELISAKIDQLLWKEAKAYVNPISSLSPLYLILKFYEAWQLNFLSIHPVKRTSYFYQMLTTNFYRSKIMSLLPSKLMGPNNLYSIAEPH